MAQKNDYTKALLDLDATLDGKKQYTDEQLLGWFPEFTKDNIQAARDYVETKRNGKYKDENELNGLFPEFFGGNIMSNEQQQAMIAEVQASMPEKKANPYMPQTNAPIQQPFAQPIQQPFAQQQEQPFEQPMQLTNPVFQPQQTEQTGLESMSQEELTMAYNALVNKSNKTREASMSHHQKVRNEMEQYKKEHPFLYAIGVGKTGYEQASNQVSEFESKPLSYLTDDISSFANEGEVFLYGEDKDNYNKLRNEIGRRLAKSNYGGMKEDVDEQMSYLESLKDKKGVNQSHVNQAIYLTKKAQEQLNAGSTFDETDGKWDNAWQGIKNWGQGVVDNTLDRKFFATASYIQGKQFDSVIQKLNSGKKLTEEERALIEAMYTYETAQGVRSFDKSQGYYWGELSAESVPFMVDMMLTRGLSSAGKRVLAREMAKTAARYTELATLAGSANDLARSAKFAGKADKINKFATLLGGAEGIAYNERSAVKNVFGFGGANEMKVLGGVEKAGWKDYAKEYAMGAVGNVAQTAAMPTTWNMVVQDKINKHSQGEEYSVGDWWTSVGNAYVETLTENTAGKMIDRGLGAWKGALGVVGSDVPWYRAWASKTPRGFKGNEIIQSPLTEAMEEYVGACINGMRSWAPWHDQSDRNGWVDEVNHMFTQKGFTDTFMAIAPMSFGGGAINLVKVPFVSHFYNTRRGTLKNALIKKGASEEQAENIMKQMEMCENFESYNDHASQFVKNLVSLGYSADNAYKMVNEYTKSLGALQYTVRTFDDEISKLTPEQKAELEKNFKDLKKNIVRNEFLARGVDEETKAISNEESGNVIEVSDRDGNKLGYVVKGNLSVEQDENTGDNRIVLGRSDNEVLVRGLDGKVTNIPTGNLVVDSSRKATDIAEEKANAMADLQASQDQFQVGDAVFMRVNGEVQQDAKPSHVLSVSQDGVHISTITEEGVEVEQVIPHVEAQQNLVTEYEIKQRENAAAAEEVQAESDNQTDNVTGIYRNGNTEIEVVKMDGEYRMKQNGALIEAPVDESILSGMGFTKIGESTPNVVAETKAEQQQAEEPQQKTPAQAFVEKHGDKAMAALDGNIAYAQEKLSKAQDELAKAEEAREKLPTDEVLEFDPDARKDVEKANARLEKAKADVEKKQAMLDHFTAMKAEIEGAQAQAAATAETAPQAVETPAVEQVQAQQPTISSSAENAPSVLGRIVDTRIRKEIEASAKKLGVPVRILQSKEELDPSRPGDANAIEQMKRGKMPRAWYRGGEVTVFVPAINTGESMSLLFHEVVSHKGLRMMLGNKQFKAFCRDVFNSLSEENKEKFAAYAYDTRSASKKKATLGKNAPMSFKNLTKEQKEVIYKNAEMQQIAGDEYVAHLAEHYAKIKLDKNMSAIEKIKFDWDTLKDKVSKFLKRVRGIDIPITDEDLISLLEQSRKNLADSQESIEEAIEDNNQEQVDRMMDGEKGVVFNKEGEVVAENKGEQTDFSIATWENGGRAMLETYLNKKVKSKDVNKEEAENLLAEMDRLVGMANDLKDGKPSSLFGQWSVEEVRMIDGTSVPVMHALKKNSEYALNIDFSSVCKKRMAVDHIMNKIINDGLLINEELSDVDIARLNQIIQAHGLEIACGICFVDSRRYNAYVFAKGFLDKYNPIIRSLVPNLSDDQIAMFNYSNDNAVDNSSRKDLSQVGEVVDWEKMFDKRGRAIGLKNYELDWSYVAEMFTRERVDSKGKPKPSILEVAIRDTKNKKTRKVKSKDVVKTFLENLESACSSAEEKMAFQISQKPNLRMLAKAEDFVASEGWVNVMQYNEDLETLWNVQKGAAGARANESNVQYQSDVLKKTVSGDVYDIGGYRMQSFSDFIGRMWLDYMQAFADLSAMKLPGHAYTKEPSFVKLFGMMGMKVNMSLVSDVDKAVVAKYGKEYAGLTEDENGNLTYNFYETIRDNDGNIIQQGQTFPSEAAYELQDDDQYTKNAGTIAVGLSREHIKMLLRDPRIRMVIPYHKSGLPHGVSLVYNLNEVNDYTDSQNTKNNGNKKYKGDDGKELMKKDLDAYNFVLHQLSIAEDKQAAYCAIMDIYVNGNLSEGKYHNRFEEAYNEYASTKNYPYEMDFNGCDIHGNDNFLPKMAADLYIEACVAHNATPKFSEFADEADYFKVLIDFSVYDKNGIYTPQEAIKFKVPENVGECIQETLAEDEQITDKKEQEAESIKDEFKEYLADKELRAEQDRIAEKEDNKVTDAERSLMRSGIYNVGDPRNLRTFERMQDIKEKRAKEQGETLYSIVTPQEDADYADAVARGDMEKVSDLIAEAARKKGYITDTEYRMAHTAPSNNGYCAPLYDVTQGIYPEDVYGQNGLRYYGHEGHSNVESWNVMKSVRNKPDSMVTIYRAVPANVKESEIRNGDWVTTSREYAEQHRHNINGRTRIIEQKVPAKYVWTDGNSLSEYGYDDGKTYAYKNTKNGRKLFEPTYDDNGNLIPLSERFNEDNDDIRFSIADHKYNSGYASRDNGTSLSNRALSAEKDGTFSRGNFAKEYHISLPVFDLLKEFGIIKKTEWHHTGASFAEYDFYSWVDSNRADGEYEYIDAKVPIGSIADFVRNHYDEIKKLAGKANKNDFVFKLRTRVPEKYESVIDYARKNIQYTQEELDSKSKLHNDISNSNYDSRTRYEMHCDLDDEFYNKAIERMSKDQSVIREYKDANANIEHLQEQYDKDVKNQKDEALSNENSKENAIVKLGKLLGMSEDESVEVAYNLYVRNASKTISKNKEEYRKSLQHIIDNSKSIAEKKLKQWIERKKKSGKITEFTRIASNKTPKYSVTTKKEQNGKYGWFEGDKYNLPTYNSGYAFDSKKTMDEYIGKVQDVNMAEYNAEKEVAILVYEFSKQDATRFSIREDESDYEERMQKYVDETLADLNFDNLQPDDLRTLALIAGSKAQNADVMSIAKAMTNLQSRISKLKGAVSQTREKDRNAIRTIRNIARMMISSGWADSATRGDINKMLRATEVAIDNNEDLTEPINLLLDAMIHANTIRMRDISKQMLSPVTKKNQSGVATARSIAPRQAAIVNAVRDYLKEDTSTYAAVRSRINDDLAKPNLTDARREYLEDRLSALEIAALYKQDISGVENDIKEMDARIAAKSYAIAMMGRNADFVESVRQDTEEELDNLRQKLVDEDLTPQEKNGIKRSIRTLENHLQGIEMLTDMGDNKKAEVEKLETMRDYNRSLRMNLIGSYTEFAEKMLGIRKEGNQAYKSWAEEQQAHKAEILHNAMSDLEGVKPLVDTPKPRGMVADAAAKILEWFGSPVHTLMFELKKYARHAPEGKGYLYDRFAYGLTEAGQNEWKGCKEAKEMLDGAVARIFGKHKTIGHLLYGKHYEYLDIMHNQAQQTVNLAMEGYNGDAKFTAGQIMYLYMVNKMTDGKMKLREMGITEEDVQRAVEKLKGVKDGEKLVQLADYLQGEFLPTLRDKYNGTYKRMFGTSMPEIENYITLKIADTDIDKDVDLGMKDGDLLPSTIVGSLIQRTTNTKRIDLANTDALELILQHVNTMEHWNAYAEIIRDLNTLLSSRLFRNKIKALDRENFERFKTAAMIAVGSYEAEKTQSALISQAIKMVGGAKVSLRFQTAIKQILSMPAFLDEMALGHAGHLAKNMGYNVVRPDLTIGWCMKNLPLFEKRWKSKLAGNEKLDITDGAVVGEKQMKKLQEVIGKYGLAANSAVDIWTCALGAKTMYDYKLNQYKDAGFSEEEAHKKALLDAEICYNETQQSAEGMFMSKIQKDRDFVSTSISMFNNSSFAYGRKFFEGCRELYKAGREGKKEIEFRTKQLVRQGLTEEQAKKQAKKDFRRAIYKSIADIAIFGYGIQLAWNIGGNLFGLILGRGSGDDDEEKKEFWKGLAIKSAITPLRGIPFGDSTEKIWGRFVDTTILGNENNKMPSGKQGWLSFVGGQTHPFLGDLADALGEITKDSDKRNALISFNYIVRLASQGMTGVDPQTIANMIYPIIDRVENGGDITWLEVRQDLGMILNAPQSQVRELVMTPRPGETANDVAKRYGRYKMYQNYGLFYGFSDDKPKTQKWEKDRMKEIRKAENKK